VPISIPLSTLLYDFISDESIFTQLRNARLNCVIVIIRALTREFLYFFVLFNLSRQQSRRYRWQCEGVSFIKNNTCNN
jgi:hypothetical protein